MKPKKHTKLLVTVLCLLVLFCVGFLMMPYILSATVREYRTIANIRAPIQVTTEVGTATVSGTGWKANMKYLASYDIEGLVVGTADYEGDSLYDRASPRDISLAWGDTAAHSNLIMWERGNREMSANISIFSEWIIGKSYDELVTQFSNNHLIPMDQSILSQLKHIQRGDHVRLVGYLVDLRMYDKDNPLIQYELKSSLERTDEGEHACEVMYVTEVKVLD